MVTGSPARRLWTQSSAPTGSIPMMRAFGASSLTAVAVPESNPPPPSGVPGPFALCAARRLRQLVVAAGFTGVETGTVTAVYELDSPELATRWLRDVAPPISSLVNDRPSAVQKRVWEKVTEAWGPYTTADGRVRLENEALWVAGSK